MYKHSFRSNKLAKSRKTAINGKYYGSLFYTTLLFYSIYQYLYAFFSPYRDRQRDQAANIVILAYHSGTWQTTSPNFNYYFYTCTLISETLDSAIRQDITVPRMTHAQKDRLSGHDTLVVACYRSNLKYNSVIFAKKEFRRII